ncbi:MAG: hypothetical protein UW37_C0022G0002 [Candidatus Gottesmanbacteria bacterium GW2011_GWA2_44_17]|uniref:Uncharacterized protein n=3 Tax=Candidatus Gottesmaniibacteriota TaxID=1752720 RepID=A0A0G1IMQ9_9BACT|nr:MAG: hypothetical protein UV63_C0027G0008 [Microgenomates group bacterium GW2011_GWC1_43_11]KKT35460.1 MAG: hypothetical protein UW22_C0053G0020 [Candidatus Gottesmanbacteria bacterium GW2011_GWB1_44_11c]KKT46520.1 MAG: hypothetical protein UW37_C0022G0002 [Candidatus Gottesmanbacteria bacterium GW2011_GWA2_44_17]KKT60686.1 MAG: hypothetical protein UW52_C0019G0014 [Candidatus Gottesmanbacteria bacterium GW2011_GWA1_44_24b]HCM82657.1 hypothetical protein [Patescibacteria group bacterium]
MSAIKQIIGSFGEIGQEVIKEAVTVPGDIAGKALESVGTPSGKKQGSQQKAKTNTFQGEQPFGDITNAVSGPERRAKARRALEAYVGYGKPHKEPTVWEKKQMEEKQRERAIKDQKKLKEKEKLPTISTKPKQGQRYGIFEKISEAQKNVKAE